MKEEEITEPAKTFPEHEMAKPRKIIELRDKQTRDTNSRCVCGVYKMDRRGWLLFFGPWWKSGKLHVQRKSTEKIQNNARFEIFPLNAGSPCVRERKIRTRSQDPIVPKK